MVLLRALMAQCRAQQSRSPAVSGSNQLRIAQTRLAASNNVPPPSTDYSCELKQATFQWGRTYPGVTTPALVMACELAVPQMALSAAEYVRGVHCWRVAVDEVPPGASIAVGFVHSEFPFVLSTTGFCGAREVVNYHSSGQLLSSLNNTKSYWPARRFGPGDLLTITLDFNRHRVEFKIRNVIVGLVEDDLTNHKFRFAVSVSAEATLRVVSYSTGIVSGQPVGAPESPRDAPDLPIGVRTVQPTTLEASSCNSSLHRVLSDGPAHWQSEPGLSHWITMVLPEHTGVFYQLKLQPGPDAPLQSANITVKFAGSDRVVTKRLTRKLLQNALLVRGAENGVVLSTGDFPTFAETSTPHVNEIKLELKLESSGSVVLRRLQCLVRDRIDAADRSAFAIYPLSQSVDKQSSIASLVAIARFAADKLSASAVAGEAKASPEEGTESKHAASSTRPASAKDGIGGAMIAQLKMVLGCSLGIMQALDYRKDANRSQQSAEYKLLSGFLSDIVHNADLMKDRHTSDAASNLFATSFEAIFTLSEQATFVWNLLSREVNASLSKIERSVVCQLMATARDWRLIRCLLDQSLPSNPRSPDSSKKVWICSKAFDSFQVYIADWVQISANMLSRNPKSSCSYIDRTPLICQMFRFLSADIVFRMKSANLKVCVHVYRLHV